MIDSITQGSSFAVSLKRLIAGWTSVQVRQHRDLFEVALRAIDSYITSPKGQGMHADAMRYWNHQRSTFHQHAQQLGVTPAAEEDPALARIRLLISTKAPAEILQIRNELAQNLQSLEAGLPALTARSVGQDGLIAAQEQLRQRRLEVEFLSAIVGQPREN